MNDVRYKKPPTGWFFVALMLPMQEDVRVIGFFEKRDHLAYTSFSDR